MLDRDRFVVSDTAWEKVAPLLPGKPTDPGATGKDNRLFLEAVLWRVRTGVPWRDLPGAFGKWNSVFQRFRRWAKGGVFERVFACLSGEPDFEYALVDGTIVTAHHSRLRAECLNASWFLFLADARERLEAWRCEYNKASGAKGGLSIRPSDARAVA
jgi:transposase